MPVKDLYYQKYLKYKNKYLNLQNQIGGDDISISTNDNTKIIDTTNSKPITNTETKNENKDGTPKVIEQIKDKYGNIYIDFI